MTNDNYTNMESKSSNDSVDAELREQADAIVEGIYRWTIDTVNQGPLKDRPILGTGSAPLLAPSKAKQVILQLLTQARKEPEPLEDDEQLRDTLATVQVRIGINDQKWQKLVGNSDGLFGVVKPLLAQARKGYVLSPDTEEQLIDLFFKAAGGISDMAKDEMAELYRILKPSKGRKYITPEGSIVDYELEKDIRKWVAAKRASVLETE